jgi:fibronectin type 3 domain-containing protein
VALDSAGNTSALSPTLTVVIDQNAPEQGSTTTPTTPTNVSASAGNSTVNLSWAPPSSNGGSAITGYKLYRSTTSGNESLLINLGNVTSYADNAVVNGTTYYYQLSAVNAIGEGSRTSEVQSTTAPAITVPGAPVLNSAQFGNNSVTLKWTAPANTGGLSIDYYSIYRGSSSGGETYLAQVSNTPTTTQYTDNSVTNSGTYYYQVVAHNSQGDGARSNEIGAKAGDTNGDGHVNLSDLTVMLANLGTSSSFCDFNQDNIVNVFDLSFLMSRYGS